MLAYSGAQVLGGIAGAVLANVMFDLPAVQVSSTDRISIGIVVLLYFGVLFVLVYALKRSSWRDVH